MKYFKDLKNGYFKILIKNQEIAVSNEKYEGFYSDDFYYKIEKLYFIELIEEIIYEATGIDYKYEDYFIEIDYDMECFVDNFNYEITKKLEEDYDFMDFVKDKWEQEI